MSRKRLVGRALVAGAGSVVVIYGLMSIPLTQAAFSTASANGASSFTAASSFCVSPGGATLTAVADSEVDQNQPTTNYGNKGTQTVGTGGSLMVQRILVRFDLTAIPAGCTVTTATFRLVAKSGASGPGKVIQVSEAGAAWVESTVTWSTQPASSGSVSTTTTTDTDAQFSVLAQVNSQRAGSNHGLVVRDQVEDGANAKSTYSTREDASPPTLTLVWS